MGPRCKVRTFCDLSDDVPGIRKAKGSLVGFHLPANLIPRVLAEFKMASGEDLGTPWKNTPRMPESSISSDKILHGSWSIFAACGRVFAARHFEFRKDAGDQSVCCHQRPMEVA